MAANGGTANGVVQSCSRGFSTAAGGAAANAAGIKASARTSAIHLRIVISFESRVPGGPSWPRRDAAW